MELKAKYVLADLKTVEELLEEKEMERKQKFHPIAKLPELPYQKKQTLKFLTKKDKREFFERAGEADIKSSVSQSPRFTDIKQIQQINKGSHTHKGYQPYVKSIELPDRIKDLPTDSGNLTTKRYTNAPTSSPSEKDRVKYSLKASLISQESLSTKRVRDEKEFKNLLKRIIDNSPLSIRHLDSSGLQPIYSDIASARNHTIIYPSQENSGSMSSRLSILSKKLSSPRLEPLSPLFISQKIRFSSPDIDDSKSPPIKFASIPNIHARQNISIKQFNADSSESSNNIPSSMASIQNYLPNRLSPAVAIDKYEEEKLMESNSQANNSRVNSET